MKSITLSGGEPLLHKQIDQVVAVIPKEVQVWFFTGGINHDVSRIACWSKHISGYAVSLDGSAEQHNALRRSRRAFNDTIRFLKHVAAFGAPLQIQSMVLRQNMKHMPFIVELAEIFGAQRVLFSHVSPDGRGQVMKDDLMGPTDFEALQSLVDSLQQMTLIRLHTNLMDRHLVTSRFPKPTLHIVPSGNVLPWYGAPVKFQLGNLKDHGWDLEQLLRKCKIMKEIQDVFERAQTYAQNYEGTFVPVDDVLVKTFREAESWIRPNYLL